MPWKKWRNFRLGTALRSECRPHVLDTASTKPPISPILIPGDCPEGNEGAGNWNPDITDGFTGGLAFAGENVGWVTAENGFDAGISRTLTATLLANTEYVLSVQVGNSFYNAGETADYRLELLAGGVLLGSATGDAPLTDTWELKALAFVSGTSHAQLGQPLEIRLIAVDYALSDDHEIEFDDVSLMASPATPFLIEEFVYDSDANSVTLTWSSREAASYAVRVSNDLINWDVDLDDGVNADAGETTTRSFDLSVLGLDEHVFFRVEEL